MTSVAGTTTVCPPPDTPQNGETRCGPISGEGLSAFVFDLPGTSAIGSGAQRSAPAAGSNAGRPTEFYLSPMVRTGSRLGSGHGLGSRAWAGPGVSVVN